MGTCVLRYVHMCVREGRESLCIFVSTRGRQRGCHVLTHTLMHVDKVMASPDEKLHAARLLQEDYSKSSPLLPMFKPSFGPASLPTVLGTVLLCRKSDSDPHRGTLAAHTAAVSSDHTHEHHQKRNATNDLQLQTAPSDHLPGVCPSYQRALLWLLF